MTQQEKRMIIYGADRNKLMEIETFSRDGATLKFRGKIMGTMPITAILTPTQVRQLVKQLGLGLLLFAVTMLFRSDPKAK
jgi:hypothetical protein